MHNFNITTIKQLKQAIITLLDKRGVFYLCGELGTGKTTFVRYFLQQLGHQGAVTSPTFSLINEYLIAEKRIIHADLYRLNQPEELLYLDVREWRDQADIIFIEWPEMGAGFLPHPDLICQFSLQAGCRFLSLNEEIH